MTERFTSEFRDNYQQAFQYFIDGDWFEARTMFLNSSKLYK